MSTRRIEKIETACVAPRWGLVRILTSDGIEGFGEFTLEGHLPVLDAPGLGVRIDWDEVVEAGGTGERWKDEEMRLPDGALANW